MVNPSKIVKCFGGNFIGLRDHCESESVSGLYLNDLPLLSIQNLAKTATEEDVKAINLVRRKVRLAIQNTAFDFFRYVEKYAYLPRMSKSTFSKIQMKSNEVIRITPNNLNKTIRITSAQFADNECMFIHDGDKVHVTKDKYYEFLAETDTVYIYFNNCELLIEDENETHRGLCNCSYSRCSSNCFEYEKATIPNKNVATDSLLVVTCECNYEHLICSMKHLLALPIFYHAAGLLYEEKHVSQNIDRLIQGSKDDAKDMMDKYLEGFEDKASMYHNALKSAAIQSKQFIKSYKGCFGCGGIQVKSLFR